VRPHVRNYFNFSFKWV